MPIGIAPAARPPVERDRREGQDDRQHHHDAHRLADQTVAEQAVLVDVDEELAALASVPPASPVSMRRPSIASGRRARSR